MHRFNRAGLLASSMLIGLGVAIAGGSGAVAQDEEDTSEVIVVTGTRILQSNLTSPTPVNVFNSEQIELSGAINTSDLIRTLPAAGVSALTSTNSNFLVQSSGLNTVELRELGEDRTLVLVNGRRFVGGIAGSQNVDFNSIPTEFIDRIDVLTGGASAIYGSDALAGVVNVILKTDFEGVVASAQHGLSEEGDNENFRISTTMGSQFDGGRGHALASYTWSKENGVFARDREETSIDGISCAALGACDPVDWLDNIIPFYSSFGERGRIIVPRARYVAFADLSADEQASGDFVADVDGFAHLTADNSFVTTLGSVNRVFDETTGTVRPFQSANADGTPLDGFNRQAVRAIAVPLERHLFSSIANYEVSPALNFFFEGTYASTQSSSQLEPFPMSGEDVFGDNQVQFIDEDGDGTPERTAFGIPITNPYVPAGLAAAARDGADFDGDGTPDLADDELFLGFARRMTELEDRGADNLRQTARVVLGVDGEINPMWDYETSLVMGRTTQAQQSTGQINVVNFLNALDAEVLPGGAIQCASEIARVQGCVPINIFGVGAISPEAAAYVKAPSSIDATLEQYVLNGFLSGELPFTSPAATDPVALAFGGEYRFERSESVPDALSQVGLNAGNISPVVKGDFNVKEVFGELQLPLLADMQLADDVRLGLSGRWSDYSTVGDTFAWAVNGEWSPVESLRLRAQYAEAVRAPNIGELFQPPSETFEGGVDPCVGLTLSGGTPAFLADNNNPGAGADPGTVGDETAVACYQDPALVARVARDGWWIPTQSELQGIGGFNGGNPDLKEETAETITVGFVFSPSFGNAWLDNFALSVDYYDIEITDAIQGLARQTSLDQCYAESGGVYDPASVFCTNVVRFAAGPNIGAIDELNALQQNLATLAVSGVDVQASYSLPLNDLFMQTQTELGVLDFSLTYGFLESFEETAFPGADPVEFKGTQGQPENEVLFATVYSLGGLTVAWDMNWLEETVLEPEGDFSASVVQAATFHDVQVRYEFPTGTQLIGGVDNLTDEFVPYGFGFPDDPASNTEGAIFDAIGRRYYVGVRQQF